MVLDSTSAIQPNYDRKAELKAFDETKTGVKGLVDAGITQVPRIFHVPSPQTLKNSVEQPLSKPTLPTIDLEGINKDPIRRKEVIKEVKDALESWGFFQMVNHGIPNSMLEEVKKAVKGFFEQDDEVKKQWYSRDTSGKIKVPIKIKPNIHPLNLDAFHGLGSYDHNHEHGLFLASLALAIFSSCLLILLLSFSVFHSLALAAFILLLAFL
ncbi:2-oxoglutarate (2OG) and Fe(II)-dependent oxygenase superfamily protein [Tanacetum coccineum]|uniref:2-oxoglutarate (2OG) and Fe(II)-dependent oxygenase superfamily protein n=1 Tax=Tanacetum coccineum TaxID=301880 RepID=A0ABQ5GDB8_9ASTR